MTHDETSRPSDSPDESGDTGRDRQAAADWIADRIEGENITSDIDGTVTIDDAASPPDPDAYGHAETDTLDVEEHEPASRDYPRPDAGF
ncbi:hypothetical protein ITJ38_11650 [Agreia pratensis]|uniref:hypothetical protein n=1 Tax=Agreia pratensis TaxID=150121 RepID=UPI00188C5552|nr:hypothetical protein [Agreia pratensis]MBF4635059.1 hypothetical protein [Agreia pratensis]